MPKLPEMVIVHPQPLRSPFVGSAVGGAPVQIELQVHRFRCSTPECPHRYFIERVPEIALTYRRRTNQFQDWLSTLAFALAENRRQPNADTI